MKLHSFKYLLSVTIFGIATKLSPKLIRIALVLGCLLCTFDGVWAQSAVIKFNLVSLLQKNFNGALEVKLSDKLTAASSFGLISDVSGSEADTTSIYSNESGFLVAPELRYYFGSAYEANAPNGFFIGGNFF